jgi:hypothetical protein
MSEHSNGPPLKTINLGRVRYLGKGNTVLHACMHTHVYTYMTTMHFPIACIFYVKRASWQVAHACDPSWLGGRDQKDRSSKPVWVNSS